MISKRIDRVVVVRFEERSGPNVNRDLGGVFIALIAACIRRSRLPSPAPSSEHEDHHVENGNPYEYVHRLLQDVKERGASVELRNFEKAYKITTIECGANREKERAGFGSRSDVWFMPNRSLCSHSQHCEAL